MALMVSMFNDFIVVSCFIVESLKGKRAGAMPAPVANSSGIDGGKFAGGTIEAKHARG